MPPTTVNSASERLFKSSVRLPLFLTVYSVLTSFFLRADVIFDTGSADLWVPSSKSSTSHTKFSSSASSTVETSTAEWDITYGALSFCPPLVESQLTLIFDAQELVPRKATSLATPSLSAATASLSRSSPSPTPPLRSSTLYPPTVSAAYVLLFCFHLHT